jgi:pantetheine-phosphate adenylyltransferase
VKALYAGSFDPPHLGHLDIIRRAAKVCDQLVLGIGGNSDKKPFLPALSRVEILRAECASLRHVEVTQYSGATVHWAKSNGVTVLIRGLRHAADLDAEAPMAAINRANGFETLFLVSDPALAHISSRIIREVMSAGLSTDSLIAPRTYDAIRRWSAP